MHAKLKLSWLKKPNIKLVVLQHFTPRPASTVPLPSTNSGVRASSSNRPDSVVSNAKKTAHPAASGTGSSMSTARNRDMACHTCGGKGHFKKDCPNKKVMLINEDNEYETGDDADPDSEPLDDEGYSSDGPLDAYATHYPTIICSQKVLNVTPSSENQQIGRASCRERVLRLV